MEPSPVVHVEWVGGLLSVSIFIFWCCWACVSKIPAAGSSVLTTTFAGVWDSDLCLSLACPAQEVTRCRGQALHTHTHTPLLSQAVLQETLLSSPALAPEPLAVRMSQKSTLPYWGDVQRSPWGRTTHLVSVKLHSALILSPRTRLFVPGPAGAVSFVWSASSPSGPQILLTLESTFQPMLVPFWVHTVCCLNGALRSCMWPLTPFVWSLWYLMIPCGLTF